MARIKQVIESTKEIRRNIRDAVPWDLTCTDICDKEALQADLKMRFFNWANTWIIPEIDKIDEAINYRPSKGK